MVDKILEHYEQKKTLLESFSSVMRSLILALLESHEIRTHSITARVKTKESLLNKLNSKMNDGCEQYSCLDEITDIVGLRVISHYSDEVDKIASVIEEEFEVNGENSIDKRKILDPDRFGYLSLHYVVKLNSNRGMLQEYRQYSGLKCEIQVRSILQHTWAEIEHDIGYKSAIELPREVRRQFSRLAGLLEIADEEFVGIRDHLQQYAEDVEAKIDNNQNEIEINTVSIKEFINKSRIVREFDKEISSLRDFGLDFEFSNERAAMHLRFLDYLQIKTISQLVKKLENNKENIIALAKYRKEKRDKYNKEFLYKEVPCGISCFYLYQVLIAKTKDLDTIMLLVKDCGLGCSEEIKETSEELLKLSSQFK